MLFERCLMATGVILLAIFLAALLHRAVSSRLALWRFENARTAVGQKESSIPSRSDGEDGVDVSLWAEKRIQAYRASLLSKTDPPLAVLEIAKLGIRVPVFDGTDDLTLNRGVGRIIGTAKLGETGNIGIAGHRDGFFRGLKDISEGDEIDLATTAAKAIYIVDQIEIVSPADVRVLQPRRAPSITLVTCYPFYFVGDAPKRFIVHASLASNLPHGPQAASRCRGQILFSTDQQAPETELS
jgi:sortase A